MLIFDLKSWVFSDYEITRAKTLPKVTRAERIVDIKCHPEKMHRILLAYESEAILVWSINKDKAIASIDMRQLISE